MAAHDQITRGVLSSLLESLLMVVISILVKNLYSDDFGNVSVILVLFARYGGSLPLLLTFAFVQRGRHAFAVVQKKTLLLRIVVGLISLSCFYAAMQTLLISKVTTLFLMAPVVVVACAPLFLGEKVTRLHWLATGFAYLGVLILLRPDTSGWLSLGVVFGLASPLFGAGMFILVRKLGDHDAPITTALWYNMIGALVFAGLVVVGLRTGYVQWPESPRVIAAMIMLGMLCSGQQFLLAFSHSVAAASFLAIFRYVGVPLTMLADVVLFGASLSGSFILGCALIVMSASFITLTSRQKKHPIENERPLTQV
ncbi:MAG: DMT family transporter [Pseudomonadota bacterium]